ncbi:hypothetical protein CEP51_016017 [Fusarium floridanum]|uniref:RNase III domain-containing protein n=1 Tax=Fusarium floridanum TaxID=1325733 RepID=A0A428NYS0_9HYPO|nr:hypothetical protein CEP51_016017 [Fusarium floridanum]
MNNTKRQGNKRLALIGDAVLRLTLVDDGIVLGENYWEVALLHLDRPKLTSSSGECQAICTAEASNTALYKIEEQHHLSSFIQTNPAQKGHVSRITGAITVEALIGAVWLDCGRDYAHVHEIIHDLGIGQSLLR